MGKLSNTVRKLGLTAGDHEREELGPELNPRALIWLIKM